MRKDSPARFRKLIQNSRKITIVTHWNPDGDAMGSSLGLYHFLKSQGCSVKVIVPNAYPDFLGWLPGTKSVINFSEQEKAGTAWIGGSDLIFTLDFNSFKRLEKLGELISRSDTPKVLIDHHPEADTYASFYYYDPGACSTCELVYRLIASLKQLKSIGKKTAACLYTGIMTDTGSFRYPCVTPDTHRVIAGLLETGIVPADIHSAVYDSYSYDRLKLLGYALSEKLTLVKDLPAAYMALTSAELSRFNYQKGDTEGLVNQAFSIKGIRVSALFTEAGDHIRVSLRSKGSTDVNKFARQHFNGGGHRNAAGGKSFASLQATVGKFSDEVGKLF